MSLKKLFLLAFCLGFIIFPTVALAQYGLNETAGAAGLANNPSYPSDVPTLIGNVIGTALSMIAVIFFILMVYGGFLWMTAHGDSGQVDKARDTIIAAVIGIIVVLASYAITNFVFKAASGAGNAPAGGAATNGAPPAPGNGCCVYTTAAGAKEARFGHSQETCNVICIADHQNCRLVPVANEAACNAEL